jgi:hypothetical protein
MEIWKYYNPIRYDAEYINKLKKLVILKKTSKPKSVFFWSTIVFIIYLIFCLFTNSNALSGFAIYTIMSFGCLIWNIFAKRAGNVYWRNFINIAADSDTSDGEKLKYFTDTSHQETLASINNGGRRSILFS